MGFLYPFHFIVIFLRESTLTGLVQNSEVEGVDSIIWGGTSKENFLYFPSLLPIIQTNNENFKKLGGQVSASVICIRTTISAKETKTLQYIRTLGAKQNKYARAIFWAFFGRHRSKETKINKTFSFSSLAHTYLAAKHWNKYNKNSTWRPCSI